MGGGCRQGAHTHTPYATHPPHPPAIHRLLQRVEDGRVVVVALALVKEVIEVPVGEGTEYAVCDGRAGGEDLGHVVVVVAFPLHRWLQS